MNMSNKFWLPHFKPCKTWIFCKCRHLDTFCWGERKARLQLTGQADTQLCVCGGCTCQMFIVSSCLKWESVCGSNNDAAWNSFFLVSLPFAEKWWYMVSSVYNVILYYLLTTYVKIYKLNDPLSLNRLWYMCICIYMILVSDVFVFVFKLSLWKPLIYYIVS